ncbi:Rap1a/Tai family immunity protein [Sulfitobacter mediterraneus]|uniref:Rap1a/Tai family immunity protein n=1 Tax=Sulfitobacter mediterraneus TaxID=83219 RepID=UPI0021A4F442|nr:Rap1a/Tai family immunity protein [Sulfitobacter mediterraneus]UWR10889.1 hypothetical protein K3753_16815 [Sulfitobacter mediterraneus]
MKKLLLTVAVMASPAFAENDSGNTLYAACSHMNGEATVQAGYCIGYLTGVWEGMKLGASLPFMLEGENSLTKLEETSNQLLRVCMPSDVERGQMVDVVIKYLDENPADRHGPARMLTWLALLDAFPCN